MSPTLAVENYCYSCPHDLLLSWRMWGDRYVFYEETSGTTHMLDNVSGKILLEMYDSLLSESEALKIIENSFSDIDAKNFLSELVFSFKSLGLLS